MILPPLLEPDDLDKSLGNVPATGERQFNVTSSQKAGMTPERFVVDVEGASGNRAGLVASALFHAGIIAATVITFAHASLTSVDDAPTIVPVDLVKLAQTTDIAPTIEAPPQVVQAQVRPPPLDELQAPDVPLIREQSAPPPTDSALQSVAPLPTTTSRVQRPSAQSGFSTLLNKLTLPSAGPKNAMIASRTVKGLGAQDGMTMSLADDLRNQIEQCWNAPIGAANPAQLIVTLQVFLSPDGSVAQPPQLTASSAAAAESDVAVRAAADAAKRALYVCAPYKLPADRYQTWHNLDVTFDPRSATGG